jgi:hypothetical protein
MLFQVPENRGVMSEMYAIPGTSMKAENPSGARPDRGWLQKTELAEPVFYVGTIGLICLYLWLMISYWIS